MKKAGIIMLAGGIVLVMVSAWDLFGAKDLPVPLTVTVFLTSIASVFMGPAFMIFPLSPGRRKKIASRSLIISLVLVTVGWICVALHILGARIEIMFGILMFCFFYGTLAFQNKYEKWKIYTRSKRDAFFLCLFDFMGIGALALGALFKKQHWPYANILAVIGMFVLAIGMIAWNQKFKKEVVFRKATEDKLKGSLEEIEQQKQTLEEKQKEIIDSITYARRIQKSLLPTEKYIGGSLSRLNKNNNKNS